MVTKLNVIILFKDGNGSGPASLQNKDFPKGIFEAAINTSNAST